MCNIYYVGMYLCQKKANGTNIALLAGYFSILYNLRTNVKCLFYWLSKIAFMSENVILIVHPV